MNKRGLNYFLYFITFLVIVYYALNLSGILVFNTNPTTSNEPNIPMGSRSISTNLISYKKGDFVCYNFYDEYLGNHFRVHRLIGVEGDIIEIKKGVVFVNAINFDQNLNLVHYYKTAKVHLDKIKASDLDFEKNQLKNLDSLHLNLLLEDSKVAQLDFKVSKFVVDQDFIDQEIASVYNEPWNKDHFGPITVPKGKIFVLGDNRDYTFDSRNIGFIEDEEIVRVVVKIF